MAQSVTTSTTLSAAKTVAEPGLFADYATLFKVRVTVMVIITAAAGFYLGSLASGISPFHAGLVQALAGVPGLREAHLPGARTHSWLCHDLSRLAVPGLHNEPAHRNADAADCDQLCGDLHAAEADYGGQHVYRGISGCAASAHRMDGGARRD